MGQSRIKQSIYLTFQFDFDRTIHRLAIETKHLFHGKGSMITIGNNKRKYARAIFCTEADAKTYNGSFKCLTLNLTPDGMLIKTQAPLALGQNICISFQLPDSQDPIRVDGNVVRLAGECAGIKFTSPISALLAS